MTIKMAMPMSKSSDSNTQYILIFLQVFIRRKYFNYRLASKTLSKTIFINYVCGNPDSMMNR